MTTQQLETAEPGTLKDDRLQALMTQLIDVCAGIGHQRDDQGRWQPAGPGPGNALEDAREVLVDLSRALAKTRRGLRAIVTERQNRMHRAPDIARSDLP
ncbi:hypothetical protein [Streptomyces sp. NPDC052701]|uniref:hypothetical protein n=1 Tax=Streptomyces sp. NPDC052701 TaxID=3155533 RepID=UPI00341ABDD9